MNPAWDWLYRHHLVLLLVLTVASALLIAGIAAAVRHRSAWHGVARSAIPLVVVVVVVAAWLLSDRRALASDIDQRLEQVASALPAGTSRTATRSGDNYRTDSYVVRAPPRPALDQFRDSISRRLGPTARLFDVGPEPPQLGGIDVSFVGRACDGSLDVSVLFATSGSDTAVEVSAHCED